LHREFKVMWWAGWHPAGFDRRQRWSVSGKSA
jgi:hypothetical protein